MKKKLAEFLTCVLFLPLTVPALVLCKLGEFFTFLYNTYDRFLIEPIGSKVRSFLVSHDLKDK